jgi:TRAP-type C4-dicarboxylate transport system substrate-binding protein
MKTALALVLLWSAAARADDVVLRFASVAPEGSEWARELRAFARRVETASQGHVKVKWYMNAVAGEELEELDRLHKGQLDGVASGQILCERVSPSMQIAHIPGLFRSRDEIGFAVARLLPDLDAEARRAGMVLLTTTVLGPGVVFSRTAPHSLAELQKLRLWRWDLDQIGIAHSRVMGLTLVPRPVHEAARAYDQDEIDGFIAIPAAALAFQWSAQAKFLVDLRVDYYVGCAIIAERAFARLPPQYQAALRDAGAELRERFEEVGRRTDEQLLGGVFEKQGMTPVRIGERFRSEYFAAADRAREQLAGRFISNELLARVQQLLAEHRAGKR